MSSSKFKWERVVRAGHGVAFDGTVATKASWCAVMRGIMIDRALLLTKTKLECCCRILSAKESW